MQLRDVGIAYDDSLVIQRVKRGLPASYDPVLGSLMGKVLTYYEFADQLRLWWEEKKTRKMKGSAPTQQHALRAVANTCWKCGEGGHLKKDCPKLRQVQPTFPSKPAKINLTLLR